MIRAYSLKFPSSAEVDRKAFHARLRLSQKRAAESIGRWYWRYIGISRRMRGAFFHGNLLPLQHTRPIPKYNGHPPRSGASSIMKCRQEEGPPRTTSTIARSIAKARVPGKRATAQVEVRR